MVAPRCPPVSRRHRVGDLGMENPPFLVGKSTISMAMFNSYIKLPKGTKTI